MNTNTIVILIIIIGIIIFCFNCDFNEHYDYYEYNYPRYCKSCGEKSRIGCNKCINCGYCLTPNGYGQCVPGDKKGPYFREDCTDYEYNNPIFSYFRTWFYPFWKDGYNYDIRGYPKSTYRRYIRNHPRARRAHRRWRRNRDRHNTYSRNRSRSMPKYRTQNRQRKRDVYKN